MHKLGQLSLDNIHNLNSKMSFSHFHTHWRCQIWRLTGGMMCRLESCSDTCTLKLLVLRARNFCKQRFFVTLGSWNKRVKGFIMLFWLEVFIYLSNNLGSPEKLNLSQATRVELLWEYTAIFRVKWYERH